MPAAAKRSRAAVEEDKPEYFEGFKVAESEHEGYESDGGMAEAFRPGAKRKSKRSKKAGGGTFESMGLCEEVMQGIKRKGYRLPTPIQRRTIPLIRLGIDVVGMARTGSGKTAAFVIPMLDRLRAHSPRAGARALLLAPTRELVLQTYKVVKELGKATDLRAACLVGGDSLEAQFEQLATNPDVLVATPGRLMHLLAEVAGFTLVTTSYVVFDEADRLFEMGFAEQLREIMSKLPPTRQTLLFSATLPKQLAEFARAGLKAPELVRLDAETKVSPDLRLAFFTVRAEEKVAALLHLLREVVPPDQQTVVFVATRHHVEFLHTLLKADGMETACVYGAMDQAARMIHVAKFRARKVPVMLVTDVAARGIDIPLLDNVVNFDFPPKPKLFVHRVGRAARAGRSGVAYSLATRDELPYVMDLHLFLGIRMQPAPVVPDRAMIDSGAGLVSVQDDTPSLVGCFPQVVLDAVTERVRSLMEVSQEAGLLEGMQRTLGNAFKLYKKTRPVASAESAARCKELDREGPHPLLARDIPGSGTVNLAAEIELQTYAEKLKAFRPAATVLEAEVAPARQGAGHAGAGQQFAAVKGVRGDKAALEMLRRKRAQHAPVIEDARRRRENRGAVEKLGAGAAEGGEVEEGGKGGRKEQAKRQAELALTVGEELATSRYRDEEFFIPNQRTDRAVEEGYSLRDARADALNDAVLSVAYGDRDASGADGAPQRVGPKGKGGYTWDKKKRKYVRLQYNEKVTASGKRVIKNEAGAKVRVKDGDAGSMYKLWAKKTHRRVMATGEIETETAQQRAEEVGTAAGARQRFGRERARYAPPRPDLDEDKGQYGRNRERGGVKSAAVIRKEKAAKKRMEEHVAKKRTAKGKVRSKAAKKGMRGKGKAQGKVPVRSGGVKKGGKGGRGGGGGGKKGRR